MAASLPGNDRRGIGETPDPLALAEEGRVGAVA